MAVETRDPLAPVWTGLSTDEERLGTPIVVPGAVTALGFHADDVAATLARYAERAGTVRVSRLRTYSDGALERRSEREAVARPPRPGDDLERWAAGVFRTPQFTLLLSRAERFATPRVMALVASALEPSYAAVARYRVAHELDVILGRYGATPFGIHQDSPGTNVLHFHLGPGTKRMTLYHPHDYARIAGMPGLAERAQFLALHGRTFEIAAGDAFLLPAGWFHVGESREFSAAIACKYRVPPLDLFAREILQAQQAARAAAARRAGGIGGALAALSGIEDEGLRRTWTARALAEHRAAWRASRGFGERPDEDD